MVIEKWLVSTHGLSGIENKTYEFSSKPNEVQIEKILLKHEASYVEVKKVYAYKRDC